jgi:trigger factor
VFEVDVKEVRQRLPIVVDDELGKAVGLESLAELRQEVRQQMQRDYEAASRLRLKRSLLDRLAASFDFAVPPGMVDLEFENIWRQHEAEKEREGQSEAAAETEAAPAEVGAEAATPQADDGSPGDEAQSGDRPADAKEDDEALKADYRRIAERRVRLGLLLAEVGRRNNITVSQDELNQAITREARRHPGYERQVLEFYRQNPEAIANLRAPIFEDKVVDFIVELARVEERQISPQDLLSLPDPDAADPDAAQPDASEPDAGGPDASGAAAP